MTKTGKYEEPAPNPQSVFVLNFENWDLQIARAAQALAPRVEFPPAKVLYGGQVGFEYWNLVRLVYPFENGIYCQNR